jgi:hypothetical protein
MQVTRWIKVAGVTVAVLLILAAIAGQIISVSIAESYSPGWHSHSAAEARDRGLLLAQVPTSPDSVSLDGQQLKVREAWVEPQTHVKYRFFVLRRLIRDSTHLLIVRTSKPTPGVPYQGRDQWLAYNDTGRFDGFEGSQFWIGAVKPPYPDTVRLRTLEDW